MSTAVVLDAAAFDVIDDPRGIGVRALLRRTIDNGGEIRCAAVTLAEVCRGTARTRRVEAALRRSHGGKRSGSCPRTSGWPSSSARSCTTPAPEVSGSQTPMSWQPVPPVTR